MYFKPEHRPGVIALVVAVIFGVPTWLVLGPEQFNLTTLGVTLLAVVGALWAYKRWVDQTPPAVDEAPPAVDRVPPALRADSVPPWVPELVKVPAGPFLMGSSDADPLAHDDEKPQHTLTLPTYWIGKTPVTNAQFRPFVEGDGYTNIAYWTEAGWTWRIEEKISQPAHWDAWWNGATQPVVGVSWYEAVAYVRWLSAKTGHSFRLPSEAEWEKAARGPDGRIYPWGDSFDARRLNSGKDIMGMMGKTSSVGKYPQGESPYRALDMVGNVWERCATKEGKAYPYKLEDEWAQGYLAGNEDRSIRGGAWYSGEYPVRGAYRYYFLNPRNRYDTLGLRVASYAPLPGAES